MIPRFDIYHANLHSSFLRFNRYVEMLEQEFFNGYVLLDTVSHKCYLMMLDGEPHAHLLKSQDKSEFKAIQPKEFDNLTKEDCFVMSFKCSPQYIEFLSRCHTAKMIYKNLEPENINPEHLIQKCKTGKFSGIIEANGTQAKKKRIYFDKGNMIGTMNIGSNDDMFSPDTSDEQIYESIGTLKLNLYEFAKQANTIESASGSRENLIQCYQEIMQLLEASAGAQDFSSIWRISAMELSKEFSFLDPFVAEFSYANQTIDLWEQVDLKQAAKGMDKLCESIAKTLRMPKDKIKDIKTNYKTVLSAYEIRN